MRALVLTLLVCACSGPTGAPQTWPPPLGMSVEAIFSGNLDGDGIPEIIAFGTGGQNEEGVYLVEGARDVVAGQVRSFSSYLPLPLAHPTAGGEVTGSDGPRVYAAYPSGSHVVVSLANATLANAAAPIDTTITAAGTVLWARPLAFPGDVTHLAVSNGSEIRHLTLDGSDNRLIPPPSGSTWPVAELATTYASGADTIAVVATATEVWRSPVPGPSTTSFAWTQVITSSARLGQTALDLDGDGREEILGFDLATHELTAIDPDVGAEDRVPLGPAFSGTEVTILGGANLLGGPGPDLVVAQASATGTDFVVVEDYTWNAGLSVVETSPRSSSIAHGRPVITSGGPGTPNQLLVFGADGSVACVIGC